jgi:hypothetical protein
MGPQADITGQLPIRSGSQTEETPRGIDLARLPCVKAGKTQI